MTWVVVFEPAAQAEIAETFGWYDDKSYGLGGDFLRVIAAAAEQISRNAESYIAKGGWLVQQGGLKNSGGDDGAFWGRPQCFHPNDAGDLHRTKGASGRWRTNSERGSDQSGFFHSNEGSRYD